MTRPPLAAKRTFGRPTGAKSLGRGGWSMARKAPRAPRLEPLRAHAGPSKARPEVRAWLQRFLHE